MVLKYWTNTHEVPSTTQRGKNGIGQNKWKIC